LDPTIGLVNADRSFVRFHVTLHFHYRVGFRIGFDDRTMIEPRFPQ
jgi:hypothetical protein